MVVCLLITSAPVVAQESGEGSGGPPQAPNSDFYVRLDTTKGQMIIKVFYTVVPYTAGRFLSLVQQHFYDGLPFHRVEYSLIQGGDPNGNGTGSYVDPETGNVKYLKLETSPRLKHAVPGMVAMARANHPDSGSCQFYITKRAMPVLDGKYSVFGQVIRGVEFLWEIKQGDRILRATILGPEQEQAPQQQVQQPQQEVPQPSQQPVLGDPGF